LKVWLQRRHELGLDKSIAAQYRDWLVAAARFDLVSR
jgi:ABC-type dipeptide/oligopeptide/nickel transport system permease component